MRRFHLSGFGAYRRRLSPLRPIFGAKQFNFPAKFALDAKMLFIFGHDEAAK